MRISLNWLQDLVDLTLTPEALADALTMAGFEVEEIEDRRAWADGVVIGKVLSREKHPNADKLSVCTVDIGAEQPSTIVCGAANVRADIFVAVATLGTYLPKVDLKIKPRKLRDVPSEGMICSLAEVGLAKDSEGIHIFEQPDLKVGSDVRPYLGLDDVILDLTSTANRADALSMVGIAREVAAITGAKLHLPEIPELTAAAADLLNVKIEQGSSAYIATLITGLQLAPSPDWLQRRIIAAGSRPINNIVDVTNYIMLEWGQPLHAFDYDRLQATASSAVASSAVASSSAGRALAIGVRQAQSGETLTTLDGQQRKLPDLALLITANDQPVAIAGIMGGESTEVCAATQTVMLEAAAFDPAVIRRSARALGMRTEASARFERGVNQAELMLASRRAIDLLGQLAGGKLAAEASEIRHQAADRTIELRLSRINQVLGPVLAPTDRRPDRELTAEDMAELKAIDIERTLTALGCELTSTQPDIWTVTVPPYRYRDLEREIDLVEEVARLYGYNNFCDTLPSKTEAGFVPDEQMAIRQIHAALRGAGLTEVVHYTLGKPDLDGQVVLANPLFAEYSALRIDLMSGLIDAFERNLQQGNGPLNAFEVGRVFWRDEVGLEEEDRVAGILGGDPSRGRWVKGGRSQPITWYEAKGQLESLFGRLGLTIEYQPDRRNPLLHPGRTASLWLNGDRLGTFGQLHPQVRQQRDLPDEIYSFELSLDILLDHLLQDERLIPVFQPYSSYPASDRDIAFFAPVKFTVADIERAIRQAGGALLGSVELFDEYRGTNVPENQRSLAFRLVYRAQDRTLTEAEIEPVHQKVREALEERFQAALRS